MHEISIQNFRVFLKVITDISTRDIASLRSVNVIFPVFRFFFLLFSLSLWEKALKEKWNVEKMFDLWREETEETDLMDVKEDLKHLCKIY